MPPSTRAKRGEGKFHCPCGKAYARIDGLKRHQGGCAVAGKRVRGLGLKVPPRPLLLAKSKRGEHSIITPDHNFALHFSHQFGVTYPPPWGAQGRLIEWVRTVAVTSPRIVRDDDYAKIPLSLSETNHILKLLHPKSCPLSELLKNWGVKERGSSRDLYVLDTAGLEHTYPLGAHSDSGPVVLLQLVGEKQLRLGGVHPPPAGSVGATVPLDGEDLELFERSAAEKTLTPNSVVGFAKRQAHQLTALDSPNISLSISVESL